MERLDEKEIALLNSMGKSIIPVYTYQTIMYRMHGNYKDKSNRKYVGKYEFDSLLKDMEKARIQEQRDLGENIYLDKDSIRPIRKQLL